MPLLTTLRRSRATSMMILLATAGLVGTAGAFGACGDASHSAAADNDTPAAARTPTYTFDVVNVYPHDPGAFTQGLQWHDNRLFESTGQVGTSGLREVDLTSGRVVRQQPLEQPHFGEGMVILGDKLYQLTWQSGKAFTYDWKTFTRNGSFNYDGEGWGLTTDGTSLIMSNGSSSIVWRDPKTFAVTKTLAVTDRGTPVAAINELEWVKGEIWANVWQSDSIARIDPNTGMVLGWIDLSNILPKIDRTGNEDVLNGIAYDAAKDRIFVTGKLWSKLYEISLKPR
ncbi:MAG TPA: glutaminyl-peptide cyclotransferase [Gemmatimonas sp.]|uniref:glutaminyl-peptide cyclotransferase n=1 Tax=Gemmatimonas sp. TaxID=1962908 RepID=UPI002ED8A045